MDRFKNKRVGWVVSGVSGAGVHIAYVRFYFCRGVTAMGAGRGVVLDSIYDR
jgi:hypothetical protein